MIDTYLTAVESLLIATGHQRALLRYAGDILVMAAEAHFLQGKHMASCVQLRYLYLARSLPSVGCPFSAVVGARLRRVADRASYGNVMGAVSMALSTGARNGRQDHEVICEDLDYGAVGTNDTDTHNDAQGSDICGVAHMLQIADAWSAASQHASACSMGSLSQLLRRDATSPSFTRRRQTWSRMARRCVLAEYSRAAAMLCQRVNDQAMVVVGTCR